MTIKTKIKVITKAGDKYNVKMFKMRVGGLSSVGADAGLD